MEMKNKLLEISKAKEEEERKKREKLIKKEKEDQKRLKKIANLFIQRFVYPELESRARMGDDICSIEIWSDKPYAADISGLKREIIQTINEFNLKKIFVEFVVLSLRKQKIRVLKPKEVYHGYDSETAGVDHYSIYLHIKIPKK